MTGVILVYFGEYKSTLHLLLIVQQNKYMYILVRRVPWFLMLSIVTVYPSLHIVEKPTITDFMETRRKTLL